MSKKSLLICSVLTALYSTASYSAAPGKPTISWGDYNFAMVEIDQQQVAYEKLVKAVHDEIVIKLSWDVWSGDAASKARVLVDGKKVWEGSPANKSAEFTMNKGGRYNMVVELENQDGVSRSEPKELIIADTDGSHLAPLHHSWSENNEEYKNTSGKIVGTYFVEWSVFERNYPLDVAPLSNLNRILYGFVPICGGDGINDGLKTIPGSFEALQKACAGREDFKVAIHDPWAAIQKPQKGVENYSEHYKGNFGQMMAAKKANPQLKILPSIGGWSLSDPFFLMHDVKKRTVFIESVREYLETWKFFDGIDIDFEFPGFGGANPNLGDKEKDGELYVTLMKELRAMLDDLGAKNNRYYELTSAINIGYDKLAIVDYGEAAKYLDNIYMMSYDFYGAWSNDVLNHHTGLHRSSVNPENSEYFVSKGAEILIEQGVPAEKLVVGVAAFGRGWTGVTGYKDNNPFSGKAAGAIKGTWEAGVVDYRDIIDNHGQAQGFEYGFDEQAQAPYLFKAATGDLITFDDVRSTKVKAQYATDMGLAGIFHWEVDGDNGDLINAMHQGLGHAKASGGTDSGDTVQNKAPIAKAGVDQNVKGPVSITLNGSASSDPEGETLTYQWLQTSGDKLSIQNANQAMASVSVPATDKDISYTFSLTVTDPKGATNTDSLVITNKAELKNHAPSVTLAPTTYVNEGAEFSLNAKAIDADGDALEFTWSVPSDFIVISEEGERLRLRAPEVSADAQFNAKVTVSDGETTAQASTQISVKNIESGEGETGDNCTATDPNASAYPSWNATQVYTTETVSHNGLIYKAKWWVQGVEPSPEAEAWELLSDVELPWMAGVAYDGNAQVNYEGSRWQAKWWTKGDEPGKADVWSNIGAASCN